MKFQGAGKIAQKFRIPAAQAECLTALVVFSTHNSSSGVPVVSAGC